MESIKVYLTCEQYKQEAEILAEKLGCSVIQESPSGLYLHFGEDGLSLSDGTTSLQGDFRDHIRRLKPNNLGGELLVKAAKLKNLPEHPTAIDATAGLGEDSLLLAASGYHVKMIERDPVIAALLKDAVRRGLEDPDLQDIVSRMEVLEGDSINLLKEQKADLVYLDPMFPGRAKSGLVKKKFQLLHHLEAPCTEEEEILHAAMEASPRRVVIKRPVKAPYLAGKKPSYSISGKVIRYDCIVLLP